MTYQEFAKFEAEQEMKDKIEKCLEEGHAKGHEEEANSYLISK